MPLESTFLSTTLSYYLPCFIWRLLLHSPPLWWFSSDPSKPGNPKPHLCFLCIHISKSLNKQLKKKLKEKQQPWQHTTQTYNQKNMTQVQPTTWLLFIYQPLLASRALFRPLFAQGHCGKGCLFSKHSMRTSNPNHG